MRGRYRLQFRGRKAGAIGIVYPITLVVDAPDIEAARLKLYDTHEPHGPVQIEEVIS